MEPIDYSDSALLIELRKRVLTNNSNALIDRLSELRKYASDTFDGKEYDLDEFKRNYGMVPDSIIIGNFVKINGITAPIAPTPITTPSVVVVKKDYQHTDADYKAFTNVIRFVDRPLGFMFLCDIKQLLPDMNEEIIYDILGTRNRYCTDNGMIAGLQKILSISNSIVSPQSVPVADPVAPTVITPSVVVTKEEVVVDPNTKHLSRVFMYDDGICNSFSTKDIKMILDDAGITDCINVKKLITDWDKRIVITHTGLLNIKIHPDYVRISNLFEFTGDDGDAVPFDDVDLILKNNHIYLTKEETNNMMKKKGAHLNSALPLRIHSIKIKDIPNIRRSPYVVRVKNTIAYTGNSYDCVEVDEVNNVFRTLTPLSNRDMYYVFQEAGINCCMTHMYVYGVKIKDGITFDTIDKKAFETIFTVTSCISDKIDLKEVMQVLGSHGYIFTYDIGLTCIINQFRTGAVITDGTVFGIKLCDVAPSPTTVCADTPAPCVDKDAPSPSPTHVDDVEIKRAKNIFDFTGIQSDAIESNRILRYFNDYGKEFDSISSMNCFLAKCDNRIRLNYGIDGQTITCGIKLRPVATSVTMSGISEGYSKEQLKHFKQLFIFTGEDHFSASWLNFDTVMKAMNKHIYTEEHSINKMVIVCGAAVSQGCVQGIIGIDDVNLINATKYVKETFSFNCDPKHMIYTNDIYRELELAKIFVKFDVVRFIFRQEGANIIGGRAIFSGVMRIVPT